MLNRAPDREAGDARLVLTPVASTPDLSALDPRERALLSSRATPSRAREFVAGRSAARRALAAFGIDPGGVAILPEAERGRPKAFRADGSVLDCWLSITHADGLAAAAASAAPVGIDLIALEDLPDAFEKDALDRREVAAWQACFPEAGAAFVRCSAFAAKEAVLKLLGTGLALPLSRLRVVPRAAFGDPPATRLELVVQVLFTSSGTALERRADGALFRLGARLLMVARWQGALRGVTVEP